MYSINTLRAEEEKELPWTHCAIVDNVIEHANRTWGLWQVFEDGD